MDTFLLGNYWDTTVFLEKRSQYAFTVKLQREKVQVLRMFGV